MASLQKFTLPETTFLPPKKEAAAHAITTKVPLIAPEANISQARELLTKHSADFDTISYIYAISEHGRLVGVLSIRDILQSPPNALVENIMAKRPVSAKPSTSQERVARMAIKNNIKAIPVVDDEGKLLGVVSSDKILDILQHESHEDFLRFSGIVPGARGEKPAQILPIGKSFIQRTPWIVVGLIGGLLTAEIITGFDVVLEKHILLASFIPLVAYIANAVGTQTQTLFIRDLATHDTFSFLSYLLRQLFISALIALVSLVVIAILTTTFWHAQGVGFIVGTSVFLAIMVATFFALLIPYFLGKMKLDPAIGSGPFSTIVQDLLSILIYFSIASWLL